jgi:Flp pilus assembly protein TadD
VLVLAIATAVQTAHWRDARTLWSHVVAVEPTNAFALKSMGDAARVAGDLDAAIAWYERALALRSYSNAETNLAAILAQRGRYDEALVHHRAAIRADPRDAFAYTSYGVFLAERGRSEEAIAAHHQALAIDPRRMEAHANLGSVLDDLGRTDEAMREYETALSLRPSVEVYNDIGVVLLKTNRPAEAVVALRKALALRADVAVVHENLGRALGAGGDRAGAAAAYETALRLDPNLASARGALAALQAEAMAPSTAGSLGSR